MSTDWATRRMLQALDAYWAVCEGYGPAKYRHPHGDNLAEHWWGKFEKYRAIVEGE